MPPLGRRPIPSSPTNLQPDKSNSSISKQFYKAAQNVPFI
jgi:hypothetical protein